MLTGQPASGRAGTTSSPEILGPSAAEVSILTSDPQAVNPAAMIMAASPATAAILAGTPLLVSFLLPRTVIMGLLAPSATRPRPGARCHRAAPRRPRGRPRSSRGRRRTGGRGL